MDPEDPGGQERATGGAGAPLAGIPAVEQLMGLGAILIIVVTDFIGDILLDEYGVGKVTWLVAVAVVAAVWMHRLRGAQTPVPYRWTLIVLGYGGLVLGIREFLTDLETDILDGGSIIFALAAYAGAVLLGVGAYRLSRS